MRKALVIGVNSENNFYILNILLSKNYEVHFLGNIDLQLFYDCNKFKYKTIENLKIRLFGNYLNSNTTISSLIIAIKPEEIFNIIEKKYHDENIEGLDKIKNSLAMTTLEILKLVKSLHLLQDIKIFQVSYFE